MTDVDIRTGRPLTPQAEAAAQASADARLEDLIGRAGVAESQAAARLARMIEDHLTARIESLLAEDDTARTLLHLLTIIGVEATGARMAARQLIQKRLHRKHPPAGDLGAASAPGTHPGNAPAAPGGIG